jgi:hypothetical protein
MEECNLGHHFNDEKDCLCWVTDDFAPSSNRMNSIRMRVCVPMEFTASGALSITDNTFELMELLLVKNFADMTDAAASVESNDVAGDEECSKSGDKSAKRKRKQQTTKHLPDKPLNLPHSVAFVDENNLLADASTDGDDNTCSTRLHIVVGGQLFDGKYLSDDGSKKTSTSTLIPIVTEIKDRELLVYDHVLKLVRSIYLRANFRELEASEYSLYYMNPLEKVNVSKPGIVTPHVLYLCLPFTTDFKIPPGLRMPDLHIVLMPTHLVDCKATTGAASKIGNFTNKECVWENVRATFMTAADIFMSGLPEHGDNRTKNRIGMRGSHSQALLAIEKFSFAGQSSKQKLDSLRQFLVFLKNNLPDSSFDSVRECTSAVATFLNDLCRENRSTREATTAAHPDFPIDAVSFGNWRLTDNSFDRELSKTTISATADGVSHKSLLLKFITRRQSFDGSENLMEVETDVSELIIVCNDGNNCCQIKRLLPPASVPDAPPFQWYILRAVSIENVNTIFSEPKKNFLVVQELLSLAMHTFPCSLFIKGYPEIEL